MSAVVCGSALNSSRGRLSGSAAFPDFNFVIALTIFSLDGLTLFSSNFEDV